ncbi:uncharacterized protein LOC116021820 [Ipomoea triloba]|uniref:uncharacterized protein LOC116021820 n=1 Tax=Ipomoea triloba TaxID=35885 RepID=UPI00125E2D66|nr:uncharacterized protein LOC116021820 [Ipomoea triloba]
MDDFTRKESRYILIMAKHVIAEPLPVLDEELEDEAQINVEIEAAKIKPGAMVVVSISEDNLVATLHKISRLEDHIASKFAANEDPAPAASLGTPSASSSDHW